ncbi:MAG: hypothetical protein J6R31_04005, partial [Rikenellaceae bacterium]|nr:hypothetical protein [Rikenellaceae bacterium]
LWMDRNLGATTPTYPDMTGYDKLRAYGLHYQWGRKDPFGAYNSHVYFKDGSRSVNGEFGFNGDYTTTAEDTFEATIAKTIKNPHLFINADKSGISQWTSTTNTHAEEDKGWACLWGNPTGYAKTYGPGSINNEQGSKSIYDPCPVGWKVPSHQMFAFITNTGEDRTGTYHYSDAYKFNVREVIQNNGGTLEYLADARIKSNGNKSETYPIDRTLSFFVDDCNKEGAPADPETATMLTFMLSGSRSYGVGYLNEVGNIGIYATNAPTEKGSTTGGTAFFDPSNCNYYFKTIGRGKHANQACGISVRCVRDLAVQITDEESCIDLSAEGTANTYIANKPGTNYKFKATVKGNGATGSYQSQRYTSNKWTFVEGVAGEKQTSVTIAPVAAKLSHFQAWAYKNETYTTTSPIVSESVKYENGYIYFSTPAEFVNGNAVIAALDNNGDIVWSWHIWASENYTPAEIKVDNNYYVMDRNIGANISKESDETNASSWYAAQAVGMMYQHGRKDPFPGPLDIRANDGHRGGVGMAFMKPDGTLMYGSNAGGGAYINAASTDYAIGLASVLTSPWTFEQATAIATQHPESIINSNTKSNSSDKKDWWGRRVDGAKEFMYYWGTTNWDSGNKTSLIKKTIYDPCPAGWITPGHDIGKYISEGTISANTYGWTVTFANGAQAYFPKTGFRKENCNYTECNTHGYYWINGIGDGGCASFNFTDMNTINHLGLANTNDVIAAGCTMRAIRCVKIK